MASLLHVGLGNAAAATALALAAWLIAVALRGRRPAVVHALWLLVLLKLLTPPLWTWRVPWFRAAGPAVERGGAGPVADTARVPLLPSHDLALHDRPEAGAPGLWFTTAEFLGPDLATAPPVPSQPKASRAAPEPWRPMAMLPGAIVLVWLTGSLTCLAIVVVRTFRFRHLLRHAASAPPEVSDRVAGLCKRLGIARPPEVLLVPGAVCPMLWAIVRRPRLLLPADLWDDLNEAQRDTLIAHELAHLRRRDHWVRLAEVAATVLYWWHPVAWWARRELREAEEQCCDAWVVWSMPRCARPYMNAILMAVEFVSEAAADCAGRAGRARVAVPPVASGMASGEFRHLERRLSMIRDNENRGVGESGRTLGRAALVAVCAGAIGLLPLAPSLAQQEPQATQTTQASSQAPHAENAPRGITVITAPTRTTGEAAPRAEVRVHGAPQAGAIELRAPEGGIVVQTTPEVSVGLPGEAAASINGASITFSGAPQAELEHARSDVERARQEVQRLTAELEAARARLAAAESGSGHAGNGGAPRAPSTSAAPGSAYGGMLFRGERQGQPGFRRSQGQDSQRRLDELERKLDRLLDEVQTLKEGHQKPVSSESPAAVSRAF